ncbi:MAG: hypothetical protein RIT27_2200 [Pseudomonadota bacterium]|jgi:hypothetical protein
MKLRKALLECKNHFSSFGKRPFSTPKLSCTLKDFCCPEIAPFSLDEQALQLLYRKINHAFATNAWHEISWYEWRRTPWILWYGKELLMPAVQTGFLNYLFEQLNNKPTAIKRLLYVYLRDFSDSRPNIQIVANFLHQTVSNATSASLLFYWKKIEQQFHLFEPDKGIEKLSLLCLEYHPLEILQQAGLKGHLMRGGFAQATYRYALNYLEERLPNLPKEDYHKLEKIFIWSIEDNDMRYPICQRDLIHSVLLPWHRQTPPLELQHLITQFLLQYIGHPGIYPKTWQDIKAPAMKLFFRWLANDAIEQYFYKTNIEQSFCHQLWLHYLRTQSIDAAWLSERNTNEMQQRILLIKLPNFVFAEGVEKGVWLFWNTKNPYAPKLFQSFYQNEELTRQAEKINQDQQGFQMLARLLQQQAQLPFPSTLFGVKP